MGQTENRMDKTGYTYRNRLSGWLLAVVLLAGFASCDDYIVEPALAPIPMGDGEVQVELAFGFADEEDGYTLSGTTRAQGAEAVQEGAFSAGLVPTVRTRAGETETGITKPDALYGLYVMQYVNGVLLKQNSPVGTPGIGEKLTYVLQQSDDCQLVVFARGDGNSLPAVSGNLSNFQSLVMPDDVFKSIPVSGATQAEMNKMPYVLYLPHVKVTADGKLQSIDGAHDARLLLKRLATRLTVNWNISDALATEHYQLKEIKLSQVPADYRILPVQDDATEWGTTYPSAVSEFVDAYRITAAAELSAGKKTVWIPANVRGTSAKATSDRYRTKENAPAASSYVELVLDNSVKQERLYYRAYLGGKESTDFNLYENTDYNWTFNIKSADYRNDGRIQLLDQTPVQSTNLLETSNCFMMQPGTNICFNPYKHEAGTNGWNTYLTNGTTLTADKTIATVKVGWQTKDAGTSGDLVMGYIIDGGNHKNLVNITDAGDINKALVHVKVPVTNGGNAVIEAKNASGITVWSWHIWISDYVPEGLEGEINSSTRASAIENARAATQHGTVHTYGGVSWTAPTGAFYNCVIMDRNLGATRAGIQSGLLDAVRTFGLLYQGQRKDPFFSTVDGTASEVKTIYDGEGVTIEGGVVKDQTTTCTLDLTIRNPLTFYSKINATSYTATWGGDAAKTLYDPCPKGWRVPSNTSTSDPYVSFIAGFGGEPTETYSGDPYKASYKKNMMYYNGTDFIELKYDNRAQLASTVVGSGFIYFGDEGENPDHYTDKSAYFPGLSLREISGAYRERATNNTVYLWSSSSSSTGSLNHAQIQYDPLGYKPGGSGIISTKQNPRNYGFSVRCIQDRLQKGTKP